MKTGIILCCVVLACSTTLAKEPSDEIPGDPEPVQDLSAPDYLGRCWYEATRLPSGEWTVIVQGDPAWGNFRYHGYITLWGSDKRLFPGGFHDIAFGGFNHILNRFDDPMAKKIERVTGVWCHAFRVTD